MGRGKCLPSGRAQGTLHFAHLEHVHVNIVEHIGPTALSLQESIDMLGAGVISDGYSMCSCDKPVSPYYQGHFYC